MAVSRLGVFATPFRAYAAFAPASEAAAGKRREVPLTLPPEGYDVDAPAGLRFRDGLPLLAFDPTTPEAAMWSFRLPHDYAGDLSVYVTYSMPNATTGTVVWEASVQALQSGEAVTTNTFGAPSTKEVTVPGTANTEAEALIGISDTDGALPGDYIHVRVRRNGGSAADDAYLHAVNLRHLGKGQPDAPGSGGGPVPVYMASVNGIKYETMGDADAASATGDTIQVMAGTHEGSKVTTTINKQVTVLGDVVTPPILRTGDGVTIAREKGILVPQVNGTVFQGLRLEGARSIDYNGAGIRPEDPCRQFTVEDSYFYDNENGILTQKWGDEVHTIRRCTFDRNGLTPPSGYDNTHNCYFNENAHVIIEDCIYKYSVSGHELKSRAKKMTVTGTTFTHSGNGHLINYDNGGTLLVDGCTFTKESTTQNQDIITIAVAGVTADGRVEDYEVRNCTFNHHRPSGNKYAIRNASTVPVLVTNCTFNNGCTIDGPWTDGGGNVFNA